jgi:hypothetical protein
MVFVSGSVMNRIGIAYFSIAMVFLGRFVVDRIGIADFDGGSGGVVSGGGGSCGDGDGIGGGGRGGGSSTLESLQIIIWRKVRSHVSV